jgi:hypothetical protein
MTTGYWLGKQWLIKKVNKQWLNNGNMVSGQEILANLLIQSNLWSRSNHGLMDKRRRGALWQQYQGLCLAIPRFELI